MDTNNFQEFADNYTSADFPKIKFDWNDKFGEEFYDPNYDFRTQLCEFLIPQIDRVRLELIRDLYLETAKSSEATSGVYINFHIYAQEMLQRGGTPFLIDYIKGAAYTMDTGIKSGQIALDKAKAQELLEYFDIMRVSTQGTDDNRLFNDYIRHRLYFLVNK